MLQFAKIIQQCEFPVKFEVRGPADSACCWISNATHIPVLLQEFKLQNIVGSCDVKFPIRLEGLAYSHGVFSSVGFLAQIDCCDDIRFCQCFRCLLLLCMPDMRPAACAYVDKHISSERCLLALTVRDQPNTI